MRNSFFILFLVFSSQLFSQQLFKRKLSLLGSPFEITVIAKDSVEGKYFNNLAISEVKRIENLISDWIPTSQISKVNQNAGIKPIKVDKEVFELTKRAIYFSEITNGGFDISFAAMDKIWKFDGSMEILPTQEEINKAIAKIGYKNIVLDEKNSTIFLKLSGMKIGFGSIGKGYAAQKTRNFMQNLGIEAGIIDASGDMTTWGNQPDNSLWKIGIINPFKRYKTADILTMKNGAVTTSGDYEKFILIDGKRYSHIINPKTGYPVTGLTSVTVIGPDAEMCNGYSTSIMVLGKEKGLELIHKNPDYGAMLITDSGKIIRSKNYKKIKQSLKK